MPNKNKKQLEKPSNNNLILITGISLITLSIIIIIFAIVQSQMNKKSNDQQKTETEKTSQKTEEPKTNLQDLMVTPGDTTPPALGNQENEAEK
jgi:flagellar basal body-associated protein FliL